MIKIKFNWISCWNKKISLEIINKNKKEVAQLINCNLYWWDNKKSIWKRLITRIKKVKNCHKIRVQSTKLKTEAKVKIILKN